MCNSPLLGMHSRVISIDHATILLGPERLRNLALTTSMADFASKALPEPQMNAFWQHSFMAAMLSQYLAERRKYFEKYQAYIAGLLHDIGQIPEWMLLARAPENRSGALRLVGQHGRRTGVFRDRPLQTRATLARSWDLMPSFLDVLENHHTPELAQRDSMLVRIVGTAEYFLLAKEQMIPVPPEDLPPSAEGVRAIRKNQSVRALASAGREPWLWPLRRNRVAVCGRSAGRGIRSNPSPRQGRPQRCSRRSRCMIMNAI